MLRRSPPCGWQLLFGAYFEWIILLMHHFEMMKKILQPPCCSGDDACGGSQQKALPLEAPGETFIDDRPFRGRHRREGISSP